MAKVIKTPKEEKPVETVKVIKKQFDLAPIEELKNFAESMIDGVVHRELRMAFEGLIKALKEADGWAKNIAEVEASIAKKTKK